MHLFCQFCRRYLRIARACFKAKATSWWRLQSAWRDSFQPFSCNELQFGETASSDWNTAQPSCAPGIETCQTYLGAVRCPCEEWWCESRVVADNAEFYRCYSPCLYLPALVVIGVVLPLSVWRLLTRSTAQRPLSRGVLIIHFVPPGLFVMEQSWEFLCTHALFLSCQKALKQALVFCQFWFCA